MKATFLMATVFCLLLSTSPAIAGTIDFENMPQEYWYYGDHVNFGTYWAGVNIAPNATVLEDQVYGFNSSGYPAHSGHALLFSYSDPSIIFTFDNPVNTFSFWYTTFYNDTVTAYDSLNNVLQSDIITPNYGTNSYYSWTSLSSDIKKIVVEGTGNHFSIDDFSAPIVTGQPAQPTQPSTATPEPATMALMGLGVASAAFLKRRAACKTA